MKNIIFGVTIALAIGLIFIQFGNPSTSESEISQTENSIISGALNPSMYKSEDEWKEVLTPEQYYVLREAGTERPYTSAC